ncbi:MAG: hypothetical protein KDD47_20645 [Acidobacteria bacterium]|nr:hypothetical protein [Acidobacteriota bacterium]
MRPSIAWCLLALASCSTDLEPAAPEEPKGNNAEVRAGAGSLELAWAGKKGIYLLIEVPPAGPSSQEPSLSIKARGMVLESLPLSGVEVRSFGRPGEATPPLWTLPRSWSVEVEPEPSHRRLIEPAELRPYDSQENFPTPAPSPEIPIPATYSVGLSDGWVLQVVQGPSDHGPWQAFWGRYRDGLLRLGGRSRYHPPQLRIRISEEDGRRIHHLFRRGTGLLVVPGPDLAAEDRVPDSETPATRSDSRF